MSDLPPLPQPAHFFYGTPMYSVEQMKAYARAAIAAVPPAEAQPVAHALFRQDDDGLEPVMFYPRGTAPDPATLKDRFVLRDVWLSPPAPPAEAQEIDHLDWAIQCWNEQVALRPMVNVHRRTLDDTWRQVIRHFGGDPDALIGPSHDDLRALAGTKEGEK
jgi:hypothetical protein